MSAVDTEDTGQQRRRAQIAGVAAVVITIGAWLFIDKATDRGVERLAAYERVRQACNAKYAVATTHADSLRVDESLVSELLDNGAASAPKRCRDLRPAVPESERARKL